jgi:hypothetical protein
VTTLPLHHSIHMDGRMTFRVESLILLTAISAVPFDDLPDVSLPPARVQ